MMSAVVMSLHYAEGSDPPFRLSLPSQAFHEEYSRLYQLSQEATTLQSDPRLQHVLVYFFQNHAPNRVIERALLEQFADRNLRHDERHSPPTPSPAGPTLGMACLLACRIPE